MPIKYEIEYYYLKDKDKTSHIETCYGENLDNVVNDFLKTKNSGKEKVVKIKKVTFNSPKPAWGINAD